MIHDVNEVSAVTGASCSFRPYVRAWAEVIIDELWQKSNEIRDRYISFMLALGVLFNILGRQFASLILAPLLESHDIIRRKGKRVEHAFVAAGA